MPELGTRAVEARVDLIVYDNSASDSRAESDHHRIVSPLGSAGDRFAPCGGVSVVFDTDILDSRRLTYHVGYRKVTEGEIARIPYDSGRAFRNAGCSDAYRAYVGKSDPAHSAYPSAQ